MIIRDFISDVLKDDPRELLGAASWQAMLDVSTVYEREKQECTKLLENTNWESEVVKKGVVSMVCSACGSDLLKPVEDSYHQINLECSSCGNYEGPDLYAEKAVASGLADEAYSALKDGGESPIANCPECGQEAYVMEEGRCAACGTEAEHTCARCGNEIPAEEMLSSPLCGYCEHMSNKDD